MQFHIVAFIDILGFAYMVASDSASEVPKYLPIFREAIREVRATFHEHESLELKMFSDSIVVSAKLTPPNVRRVLETCVSLQQQFLQRGVLVRGGISLGKHYSDEHVTFSEALVTAYRIESTQARFPRIVVDKNLLDYFDNHPDTDTQLKAETHSLMRRDRDGVCFLHFFEINSFPALTDDLRALLAQQRSAEDNVLEKLRWLHDYHSYSATQFQLPRLNINGFQLDFLQLD